MAEWGHVTERLRLARSVIIGIFAMTRELARLAEGGRIVVPAKMRKSLGLDKGDAVWLDLIDGELRVRPARSALRRIQLQLSGFAPEARPASVELVVDRRIAAAGDE